MVKEGADNSWFRTKVKIAMFFALLFFASLAGVIAISANETANSPNISSDDITENITTLEVKQTLTNNANQTRNALLNSVNKNELIDAVKTHKNKLNKKTEDYWEVLEDEKEERDYIIKFKQSVDEGKLKQVNLKNRYDRFNAVKIKATAADASELISDSDVEYLELDQPIKILGDVVAYGINRTNAPYLWNVTKGHSVKVAVLDTGTGPHDDLSVAGGASIVSSDYTDSYGHGTAVAGVISALVNNEGLAGVAPEAEIYSVKITEDSSGELSNALEGVEWAIDNDMDIVSMSFGLEAYSQIFKEVLEEAYNDGILLIAASGNNGDETVLYPAAYSSVVAVGAIDRYDEIAWFSSYGAELELVAPGVDINSTTLGNGYGIFSGTSMAAPHVTGVAALIKAYNGSLTNEQIREKLRNDALDLGSEGKDIYYGYGLVQANLESLNITYVNDSYFYEVFNITYYGTSEEARIFWLNGTGTVDDINFDIGLYLVKKYIQGNIMKEILNVTENGSFQVLLVTIDLIDDYTYECSGACSTDGIVWKNGVFNAEATDSAHTKLAECFDWDYQDAGGTSYDNCYGSQSNINDCRANTAFDNACEEADPITCSTSGAMGQHSVPTAVPKSRKVDTLLCYWNGSQYRTSGQTTSLYYICDKRQYNCVSNTQYEDTCTVTGDSSKVLSTLTCNSGYHCDYSQDGDNADFGSSGTSKPNSPCRSDAPLCNGTIEVNTEDNSGSSLSSLSVYLNGTFNRSTDGIGQARIGFSNVACGSAQEITVKCSDNATICGIKSTQIDVNDDTDYLNFDCTMCSTTDDLYVSQSDVNVSVASSKVNVTIHSTGLSVNFNVSIRRQDENGIVQESKLNTVSIAAGSTNKTAFVLNDLEETDFLHIYVDANNTVKRELETNNYVFRAAAKPVKAYIDVKTQSSFLNDLIKEYVATFVESVPAASQADVIIIVGHPLSSGSDSTFKLGDKIQDSDGTAIQKPYGGVVMRGSFANGYSGKPEILAYGNRIEGTIASVKRMINARNVFLEKNSGTYTSYIDDYDTLGISVYDLLHNSETKTYFNKNNAAFKEAVRKVLFDNNFEVAVKPVVTRENTSYGSNTTLRVKNVNSDFSANYVDAVGISSKPVVLSRGIHSNLFSWQDFGQDLAGDGFDVWLVEMVGGPYTDDTSSSGCGNNCPNYTFGDLKDYYWPALIAGVQEYSGKNKVDYVGFSLGCSVALESLETHQNGANDVGYYFDYATGRFLFSDLAANPVDTFVGVACPGNFTGGSGIMGLLELVDSDQNTFDNLIQRGDTHIIRSDIKSQLYRDNYRLVSGLATFYPNHFLFIELLASFSFRKDSRMSTDIYNTLMGWVRDGSQPGLGSDVNFNRTAILQGRTESIVDRVVFGEDTDTIVPNEDGRIACLNINSTDKTYGIFPGLKHFTFFSSSLPDHEDVHRVIKGILKNEALPNTDAFQYNNNCGVIE